MTVKSFNGPWIYDPKKSFPSGYGNESEAIVDSNGKIVLMFDPSMGEYELALAYDSPNLSLILAAPDLLEALSKLTEMYCQMVHSGDCGNWNPEDDIEIQEARAAIAKATGKDT